MADEDNWTPEQHAAAEEYLTGGRSLASRVALLGQGACNCNTKTPDVHMHLATCRYRQAMELADEVEALAESLDAIRGEIALQLQQRNRFIDMPTMRAIVDEAIEAAKDA